jgi:hypothetical protein
MGNADREAVTVAEKPESDEDRRFIAKYALHPIQHAARAIARMTLQDDSRLDDLCNELGDLVQIIKGADVGRSVTMLAAQAHTLEATFYHLLEKAISPYCATSEIELYLKPALKAQAQCRATMETLVSLSNPRSVAILQANIGANIQINNSNSATQNRQNVPNKLLEQCDGNGLDHTPTTQTIG